MPDRLSMEVPDGVTRRNLLASGVAVSSAWLAGCLGDDDDELVDDDDGDDVGVDPDDSELDHIHFTQQVEPDHDYDPVVVNDVYSSRIVNHVFDGLYEYGPATDLQPKLASGDPVVEDDGTTIIVELKDGPQFANGEPVTAEDVAHSFLAPVEEETDNQTTFDMINDATAIDELTVEFDLGDEPYGPFTSTTLAHNIVHRETRLDDTDAYNEDPVGSGPYELVDWTEGDFADIELRDDYWDMDNVDVHVGSARFVSVEDNAARTSRIRAGDTDVITGLPNEDLGLLREEDGVVTDTVPSISYFYAAFNCNDGPTTNPDVRRGVSHSFSLEAFVDDVLGETAERMFHPIPGSVAEEWDFPVSEWQDATPEFDLDRASDLLSDNIEDGWEPEIISPPDDVREQLGERIAGRLREVEGVDIDPSVTRLDWGPFLETYDTGDADDYAIYTLGWSGGPDPDDFMWPLFHESSAGVNQGHYYDNPEFHDKIRQARFSPDFEERRELYIDVITEIVEQQVAIPAYNPVNSWAYLDELTDMQLHPVSSYKPRFAADYAAPRRE